MLTLFSTQKDTYWVEIIPRGFFSHFTSQRMSSQPPETPGATTACPASLGTHGMVSGCNTLKNMCALHIGRWEEMNVELSASHLENARS